MYHLYSRFGKGKSQFSLKVRKVKTTFQKQTEVIGKLNSEGQDRNGQEGGPDGWKELEEGGKMWSKDYVLQNR